MRLRGDLNKVDIVITQMALENLQKRQAHLACLGLRHFYSFRHRKAVRRTRSQLGVSRRAQIRSIFHRFSCFLPMFFAHFLPILSMLIDFDHLFLVFSRFPISGRRLTGTPCRAHADLACARDPTAGKDDAEDLT